ncbi:AAA family ATPase [Microbispora sp. RL4-1S]|uniref:AAA family ATPase n=1 Tax=Microbispora oryzae TaxID=2806554 RepID=A0A941AHL5_9ACTN|nr:LuxR family transcriptional regulator [Microbispora oryzae]MBP2702852.1 AAA family ATPase [Microbispora oryzae]
MRRDVVERVVAALARPPRIVLVHGEPGIGKTHLLSEVIARLPGVRVLRGQALELDGGRAYASLASVLEGLRDEAGPALDALYEAVDRSAVGDVEASPGLLATRLFESLPGRTLIAIDDLHLADADTLTGLQAIPRYLSGFSVLATARQPPEMDADLTVRLEPLSFAEVADLVTESLGRTPSESVLRRVHEASRGNPWFVQETVRTLVQGGAVHSAVPDSRHGAILTRLFQRDQGGRDLARVLATLTRTRPGAGLPVLAELAGLEPVKAERALTGLVRDGVVTPAGEGYALAHPLVAEALYDELSAAERRAAHAKIAAMLERDGLSGTRRVLEWAAHVAESGSPDALPAMLRAASVTRWTAPLTAAHWYGKAAEISPGTAGELLARQALSYWKCSRPSPALNSARRALTLLPPGRRHTRTAYTAVAAALAMGSYDVALDILHGHLATADDTTALLAQQALISAVLGRPSADSARHARAGAAGCPPEDLVVALGCLAVHALVQGDWPECRRIVDDLLGRSAALPPGARLAALESAAHVLSTAGLRTRAAELLAQAEQIYRGLGWHDIGGQQIRTTAVLRRLGGEWTRALEDMASGARSLAEAGLMENRALLRNMELDILLNQGRYEEAERILADPPPRSPMHDGLRHVFRARLALGRGDRAAARAELDAALVLAVPDVLHRALSVKVRLHEACDEPDEARACAARLDEVSGNGTPRAVLSAHLAVASAFGDRARALAALESAREDGLPFEEGRARLLLGALGDHAQLPRAHAIFTRLGAAPWCAAAEHHMRAAGTAVERAADLTPGERRVIQLVAGGLSNPQIAEELHYSRKTVELYLTRVYAKTGLRSRVELALAVERGEI